MHVDGARRIAEIAQASGVSRFVQMSHINADVESPSGYFRTKALGDIAVRRAFEGATIVRPASIYGHEDRFLNKLAGSSFFFLPSMAYYLEAKQWGHQVHAGALP